ncbi:hypothetical protein BGZ99_003994 [Dissophora globulifera]|uniref:C2H2-type domain-containing protein n=1 Tax=Dissophora globulifera TaxID=979702 RepID=A0A9P6UZ38_9FUNG|nr:hypothetical protein BGZ99_003994 [Dissophora globulifera]
MAAIPLLRRETTRTLCDQFTTIFDQADSPLVPLTRPVLAAPSSSPYTVLSGPLLSMHGKGKPELDTHSVVHWTPPSPFEDVAESISFAAVLDDVSTWSTASLPETLSSPTSTVSAVFTPASTPCSDTDDLALMEALSPPASPWFPTALDSEKRGLLDLQSHSGQNIDSNTTNMNDDSIVHIASNTVDDLDFFNNSFYQSLSTTQNQSNRFSPYPKLFSPSVSSACSGSSVAIAVRSSKFNRAAAAAESSKTAAPSDLYNVTIDAILSTDPLNLDLMDSSSSDSDDSMGLSRYDSTSSTSTTTPTTTTMAMLLEQVSGSQTSTNSEDTINPAAYNASVETTTRSRVTGIRRRGQLKAPRVKKQKPQRTPKIYPPRKPRTLPVPEARSLRRNDSGTENSDSDIQNESPLSSLSSSSSLLSSRSPVTSPVEDQTAASVTTMTNAKETSSATAIPQEDGCYHCELCPHERFGRVHDLKRHRISKHCEKTWPCDFCHRPFVRRDALLRHYVVKAARRDGIHPTEEETHRMSEARARAKLIS